MEMGFWEALVHGVVPRAQLCALLGSRGHPGDGIALFTSGLR